MSKTFEYKFEYNLATIPWASGVMYPILSQINICEIYFNSIKVGRKIGKHGIRLAYMKMQGQKNQLVWQNIGAD